MIVLFCLNNILKAQNLCGTPSPTPPAWIFQKTSYAPSKIIQNATTTIVTLNVFIHIVRSTNGQQGLSNNINPSIISSLNNAYLNSNIQFFLVGSDYVDNDYYYQNIIKKESQLFNVNSQPDAINIYVLGTTTICSYAGIAQNIPATAYIVHGLYFNTTSLPHEMGHCLGLYHTHHGTVNEGGDINQCAELVNGSNSATCGDYISDTPADPNSWSSNSCNYTGAIKDSNGQSYNPNPSNFMAYSYKPCRNLFSALQSQRMNDFIANTPMLQNVINRTISGSSQLCTQSTYTIANLPAGATVTWSATPSGIVSGPATGNPVTFTKVGNGIITLTATINSSITLTKQISVGAPFYLGISGISNLTMWDASDFQVLPGTGNYAYEGTLSLADGVGLATSYVWSFVSGTPGKPITWWSSGSMVDVAMKASNTTILLKCTATNYCGSYSQFYSFTNGSIVPLLLAPNPSSTQVEVSIPDAAATNSFMSTSMLASTENLSAVSYSVTVVDSYGLTVYTARVKDNKFKIPTLSFRNGIYSIVVSDGTNVYQNKLIVKH